jgi:hypothetical protein
MTDLTLCDDGVDYFEFAEAVAELVNTAIWKWTATAVLHYEKGRTNGASVRAALPIPFGQKRTGSFFS